MAPPGDTPPVVCATPLPGAAPPWVPSLAVAPGDPALTAAPGDTPSLACSALAGLAGFSFWTAVFGVTGLPAAGPDVEPAVWALAACPEKSIIALPGAVYLPPARVAVSSDPSLMAVSALFARPAQRSALGFSASVEDGPSRRPAMSQSAATTALFN